uniref:Uncharacterized protein n=1 Tax=Meloidogyne enterolobii TaxID=390850 RepID=A0A6V7W673_MELEN|nr:unnamed protein product [Meloidogyne enterolobii]
MFEEKFLLISPLCYKEQLNFIIFPIQFHVFLFKIKKKLNHKSLQIVMAT